MYTYVYIYIKYTHVSLDQEHHYQSWLPQTTWIIRCWPLTALPRCQLLSLWLPWPAIASVLGVLLERKHSGCWVFFYGLRKKQKTKSPWFRFGCINPSTTKKRSFRTIGSDILREQKTTTNALRGYESKPCIPQFTSKWLGFMDQKK